MRVLSKRVVGGHGMKMLLECQWSNLQLYRRSAKPLAIGLGLPSEFSNHDTALSIHLLAPTRASCGESACTIVISRQQQLLRGFEAVGASSACMISCNMRRLALDCGCKTSKGRRNEHHATEGEPRNPIHPLHVEKRLNSLIDCTEEARPQGRKGLV